MADAKAHLDEKAAAAASLRTDLDVRTAGLSDRREFLRRRLGEVEARLEGSMEARREAEVRRVELDGKQLALDRLAAFVGDRLTGVETDLAELRERRRQQSETQRAAAARLDRSEEHTSELQSLMRISYAVFCLKKTNQQHTDK